MEFTDRQSTYPNRYKVTNEDGSTYYVTLERADEPTVLGTPLNAETFSEWAEGFAPVSHEHSADDIKSGVLGTSRGGTGVATHTKNAVLTGNGTSEVNNVATASGALYATAANGAPKFGVLPIAQGGTGATTAAGALSKFGLSATATELNYMDGATSNVQTQLNAKVAMVKLWENASPTSSFAAQTLSIELSEYDAVQIVTFADAKITTTHTIPIARSGGYCNLSTAYYDSGSYIYIRGVTVTFDAGTIVFGAASMNGTSNNKKMIPYVIYGIKGVS